MIDRISQLLQDLQLLEYAVTCNCIINANPHYSLPIPPHKVRDEDCTVENLTSVFNNTGKFLAQNGSQSSHYALMHIEERIKALGLWRV